MKKIENIIPTTNITLKDFKKLLFEKFKAYPTMELNYKKNIFTISNTFYDNISITQRKLSLFCNKLGIIHKKSINHYYAKCIIIDLK